jgi:hypothetical protein
MTLASGEVGVSRRCPTATRILTRVAAGRARKIAQREDPVALVARCSPRSKREVTVTEIKKLLIAWNAVPNAGWTSFWNAAKKRMADDPRIDASHAFEQRYALRPRGASVTLPPFPRHDPPRKAMALLRRLMGQHKDRKAALAATWSEGLLRWADQDRLEFSDRVAALTWATELAPDPSALDGRGVALLRARVHRSVRIREPARHDGTAPRARLGARRTVVGGGRTLGASCA